MSTDAMRLLTIDEAAALLRVPKSWLYERTRTNSVPHMKVGKYLRFDQQEFLAWARQVRRDGRGRRAKASPVAITVRSSRSPRSPVG